MIVFALLGATTYIIYSQVLLPNLLTLERQEINANVLRIVHALENEQQHLSRIVNDWSAWDDTYDYIINHNIEYEASNMIDSTFPINKINLLYLLDNSGAKVWGKVVAEDFETAVVIQPFDQDLFSADFPMRQYASEQTALHEQQITGLLMTGAGPMICAARPILAGSGSGPSHGTLIMGRLLSDELIQEISLLTNIKYKLELLTNRNTHYEEDELSGVEGATRITYQAQGEVLLASTIYADLFDSPALEITVYEQREILHQGLKALRMALTLMFIGISFALVLMLLTLQKSVVTPINRLTRELLSRREDSQPLVTMNIGARASHELCLLTEEFNLLLENLDGKNTQLGEVNFSLMNEAKKLKEAQANLRNLDQLKSEFISTAAHELRTPVTSIMGFTELLSDQDMLAPFSAEQKQDFLKEIYDNSERLTKLIDDVLDVSRIEAGQSIPLDKQTLSIETLLDKTIKHFMLKAKHQISLDIKPEVPETLMFDEHRISQVMENLLSNAVKYSPQESRVSIVVERDGDRCKIAVIDQGIGMTEHQVARVFDKFYRADASDTAIRGLGLGMSIVKQIIEDHGGAIWVDSVLDEGSRIYFTLPIDPTV